MSKNLLHNQTDLNESNFFTTPNGNCSIGIEGLAGGESVKLYFAIEDPNSAGNPLGGASAWHSVRTYTEDTFEAFHLERGFIVRAETVGLTDGVSSVSVNIASERVL